MRSEENEKKTQRPIPVVGLSGGIACGKSSVLAYLKGLGAQALNADTIYKELVQPGRPLLEAIADEFGPQSLKPDGALNRAYVAQRVFTDKSALNSLNNITHPAILGEMLHRVNEAAREGFRWVIFEAAILVEGESYKEVDFLVVVSAPDASRMARIVARDGLSLQDAKTRMDAQLPLSAYEDKADYILHNAGDVDDLSESTKTLFDTLVERFGPPR